MNKKNEQTGTSGSTRHLRRDRPVPNLVRSVQASKRLPAAFFRTATGNEPVRDWLINEVTDEERIKIGSEIRTVELSWPIGMPLCRALGRSLWEIRVHLLDRIARVIFFIHDEQMVLLHGFIKKSRQIPQADIDLAMERKRQVEKAR